MKKFFEEFKEFINQGNVMDLAVAVVIGTAFTAIVNSVVSDLIMPLISLVTGGIDFSDMKIPLGKHIEEQDAPKCPFCLEEVNEGATRCPHCTAELPAPATTTPKAGGKA